MLHAKNVPPHIWVECMKKIVHVTNILSQPNLGFISSIEKLWTVKPNVTHFRVFGCVCYIFVLDDLQTSSIRRPFVVYL